VALAANAGQSWTEIGHQSSEGFSQQYPGLAFSRDLDGMPLFRMLPVVTEVVRYDGTELPKEIKIKVSSRFARPEEVAAHYKKVLDKEGLPSDECPAGSVASR
jgi:hypothetical protein